MQKQVEGPVQPTERINNSHGATKYPSHIPGSALETPQILGRQVFADLKSTILNLGRQKIKLIKQTIFR